MGGNRDSITDVSFLSFETEVVDTKRFIKNEIWRVPSRRFQILEMQRYYVVTNTLRGK